MKFLVKLSHALDALTTKIGQLGAWLFLPLMGLIIFDVITRRFFVLGSTKLQEAEWHVHTMLFCMVLGYAYLKDVHVRIDLVRENLSRRKRQWIELVGGLLFLIPYCSVVVYFGYDFVSRSFFQNEISSATTGLTHRWMIKAFIPLAFTLLGVAGVCVMLRKIVRLFGPDDLRREIEKLEQDEHEDLIEDPIA